MRKHNLKHSIDNLLLRTFIKEQLSHTTVLEGGNAMAIDRAMSTEKNRVPKTFGGREAYADEIDLRRLNRATFKRDFVEAMKKLDDEFRHRTGRMLWNADTRDEILSSGEAFNGSSEHVFGNISDELLLRYKPDIGDIDLTVPQENLADLFDLLLELEEKPLTPAVTYIGQNNAKLEGHQINALFSYRQGNAEPTFVQIDFEGVRYDGGRPSEFAKIGHGSSWKDIEAEVKGVFHKYLLSIIAVMFSIKEKTIILTDKSPLYPPQSVRLKLLNGKTMGVVEYVFSVSHGLRKAAEPQFYPEDEKIPKELWGKPVMVDDKLAYKQTPVAGSEVVQTYAGIMNTLFPQDKYPQIAGMDMRLIDSFVGLLEALKILKLKPEEVSKIYMKFISKKLFGKGQKLYRGNPQKDESKKLAAIQRFREAFPFLSTHDAEIVALREEYYKDY